MNLFSIVLNLFSNNHSFMTPITASGPPNSSTLHFNNLNPSNSYIPTDIKSLLSNGFLTNNGYLY